MLPLMYMMDMDIHHRLPVKPLHQERPSERQDHRRLAQLREYR